MPSLIVTRYRAAKANDLVPRDEVLAWTRVSPMRSALAIALEWLGIAVGIALFEALGVPWLWPLLVVWIGARQLGLWVLAHDGLHRNLFRGRRTNDLVTRLLCAWPIFLGLTEFRRSHLQHHRELKTENDPESPLSAYDEFRFPRSRASLARMLLLDLLGVNFVRYALARRPALPSPARLAFMAALLAAVATFGLWHELLLFWLVPYATWFQLVLRMRLILEHQHLPGTEPFQTRTILPGPVERLLLSPHRVHLHVEHHLYPGVPFHRLYALHERLRGRPELAGVPLRRGYLRSLLELERPIGSE